MCRAGTGCRRSNSCSITKTKLFFLNERCRRSENAGLPLVLRLLLITNFWRGLSVMEPGATLQGEGNQKPPLATPEQKGVSQLNSGLQCGGSASWPVPLLCLPCFFYFSVAMQDRLFSLELSASCRSPVLPLTSLCLLPSSSP